MLAAKHAPEVATKTLDERTWMLKDATPWDFYLDGKYRTFFHIGEAVGLLDRLADFEKDLEEMERDFQAAFLSGVAAHRGPEEGEALLKRVEFCLEKDTGMYYCNLWHKVAGASYTCNSPNHDSWVDKAIRVTFEKDKDLDMERLVSRLAGAGAIASSYKAWMKIPSGTRRHRVSPLLGGACIAKDYDALYEVLIMLDGASLNDRGQKVVYAMNTFTKSRGY